MTLITHSEKDENLYKKGTIYWSRQICSTQFWKLYCWAQWPTVHSQKLSSGYCLALPYYRLFLFPVVGLINVILVVCVCDCCIGLQGLRPTIAAYWQPWKRRCRLYYVHRIFEKTSTCKQQIHKLRQDAMHVLLDRHYAWLAYWKFLAAIRT